MLWYETGDEVGRVPCAHDPDGVNSLERFDKWLASLPDQKRCYTPKPFGDFGDAPIQVSVGHRVRSADVEIARKWCIADMHAHIEHYLSKRQGTIYWRIMPEFDVQKYPDFLEWRDDGPDKDYCLDKRGVADNDWVIVKGYARLTRSKLDRCETELKYEENMNNAT